MKYNNNTPQGPIRADLSAQSLLFDRPPTMPRLWLVSLAGGALLLMCFLSGCTGMYPNYSSSSSQQIEQGSQEIAEMRANLTKELPSYNPDYVKRVVQIIGTCQKTMESPRLMMGSINADASSQLDSLKLDFPQQRMSVATMELETIIDKISAIDKLGEPDDYPSGAAGYLAVAVPLTDYVTDATKAMHDVLVNQAQ